jgi:HK97 family phage prohead protease
MPNLLKRLNPFGGGKGSPSGAPANVSRRFTTTPVKLRQEGDTRIIEGYGAVFYKAGDPGTEYRLWEDMIERIAPTAFDQALRQDDPVALKNHDVNLLLGRKSAGTLKLSVDEVGLRYEITAPGTQTGKDTVTEIERGDMKGSSFAFSVGPGDLEYSREGDIYIITVRSLQLFDVGPVVFPAYESTTTGIRSLSDCVDLEKLRETAIRMTAGQGRRAGALTYSEVDARARHVARLARR